MRHKSETDDELAMLASKGGAQVWNNYRMFTLLPYTKNLYSGRAEGNADDKTEYVPH